jgi:hypothetical protein
VLKCFSIRESCLIFVSSLHFGGWLGCCNALLGGSATADATHLLSPTAREAGKPTIIPLAGNFGNCGPVAFSKPI